MSSPENIINKFHAMEDELATAVVRIVVALRGGFVSEADLHNFRKKRTKTIAYLETLQDQEIQDTAFNVFIRELQDACTQLEVALRSKNKESERWGNKVVMIENEILLYLVEKLGVKPRSQISITNRIKKVEQEMRRARATL